ncbi:hypothetical protein [Micromonospora rubida]|uniref:hypothetical protein n=1 Tax=Micromonospora rubida TaxID=2697657 RepID=UPI001378FE11|nr:hypothetical protein [Micromonospora rubida]NBE83912.1 hypothetical protein [Micromonospora rubida]
MQRRLVAVAPLLACVLLLHLGFACRPPPAPAVQGLVATHAQTSVDAPAPEARAAVAAPPTRTGTAPRQVRLSLAPYFAQADLAPVPARADLTPAPARADRAQVPARADRLWFATYLDVTNPAARTGRSPQGTVVASFDGRACGSVTRPGRSNPTTDRRDPVNQEASTPPDVPCRRDNTADGRPLTADAAPDPIRLSILRC